MSIDKATLAQEQALLDWMADYEPVHKTRQCNSGCGRQVARPGPCLKCRRRCHGPQLVRNWKTITR